jgi:hypothetical protein
VLTGGNVGHATSAGFLTFLCVSSFCFYTCANKANHKYYEIRKALDAKGFKEDPSRTPRAVLEAAKRHDKEK